MAVGVLSLVRDAAEIALWFPEFVERLFVPEVPEDEVVGPKGLKQTSLHFRKK